MRPLQNPLNCTLKYNTQSYSYIPKTPIISIISPLENRRIRQPTGYYIVLLSVNPERNLRNLAIFFYHSSPFHMREKPILDERIYSSAVLIKGAICAQPNVLRVF